MYNAQTFLANLRVYEWRTRVAMPIVHACSTLTEGQHLSLTGVEGQAVRLQYLVQKCHDELQA
jgi:hypothetical protein